MSTKRRTPLQHSISSRPVGIHIGFHKTASTWLQSGLFTDHPQFVLLNDFRNPWDDPLIRKLVAPSLHDRDDGGARELIRERLMRPTGRNARYVGIISAERLSGHPLSGGFDGIVIAQRMHRIWPSARILIVVRNQTSLIPSVYWQLVREGLPGCFEDITRMDGWKTTSFRFEMFEFDHLVQEYRKLFGRQNVKVMQFENVREDRRGFLAAVSRFYNVRVIEPGNVDLVSNKASEECRARAERIFNRFRRSEYNPFPWIDLSSRTRNRMVKVLSWAIPFGRKEKIDIPSDALQRFGESNRRLQILTGLDLAGYPGIDA